MLNQKETLSVSAAKSGMCENTARKYLRSKNLPSQMQKEHHWKTRKDPFEEVFPEIVEMLELNPGLEVKTIFEYLQRKYPGRFSDGQLRTLQRKVKQWKGLSGPPKEVFFFQIHHPGQLGESDFTSMNDLNISISGESFNHLLYHFVLTYSNWETGTICFSESYESLSEGLQNALWELGKVPLAHRTDCLAAAVSHEEFTKSYQALLKHYKIVGERTNPGSPHENGDVEQRHHRLKRAIEQALLLRGSRDFADRKEYHDFLKNLFNQLNEGRTKQFLEEHEQMKELPAKRLDDCSIFEVRVSKGSTIRIAKNVYSVHSRLIGEKVKVRLYAEKLEVYFAQKLVENIPRLRGKNKHCVQYRHIIDSLVRKPGAFTNYRYREDMYPTSRFRIAYDEIKERNRVGADKEYLNILYLAAKEGEVRVDNALRVLIEKEIEISLVAIGELIKSKEPVMSVTEVQIKEVELKSYDTLLEACHD